MENDLPKQLRTGISKSRLIRLKENIDWIKDVGAVVGVAYSGNSFRLSIKGHPACYLACAFCDLCVPLEIAKTIKSANEINRIPKLPSGKKVNPERAKSVRQWLRDFESTLDPWTLIFEPEIPKHQEVFTSTDIEVSPRHSLCRILDLFHCIENLPFLPVTDYEQMAIMVNPSIALSVYQRAIPGHDPWKNSPIKDPETIVEKYWRGLPIDIRKLILIQDLKFYFETILLSLIDWLDRNPETTSDVSPVIRSNRNRILEIIREKGPITAQGISDDLNGDLKVKTLMGKMYLKHLVSNGSIKNLPKLDGNRRRGYYDPERYDPVL